jgi:hypothetical protein
VHIQLLSSEVADDSGWRLALAEIKVTVFTLLRHYSFEELPSKPAIFHIMKWVALNGQVGVQWLMAAFPAVPRSRVRAVGSCRSSCAALRLRVLLRITRQTPSGAVNDVVDLELSVHAMPPVVSFSTLSTQL